MKRRGQDGTGTSRDVQLWAPGPRGVAERDELSGLQAFKYDGRWAVGEIQHAAQSWSVYWKVPL